MKIAILGIRGLPANYGGFETCADHTSKNWVLRRHKVLVYCRKSHYETYLDDISGVRLNYIKSIPIKGIDTLSHTLFSIFNLVLFNSTYTNVHLYNSGNGIFIPLLKLFNKKVIISVDGIEWKRKKWGIVAKTVHKIGAYFSVKFSDGVIADNKEVYDFYKDHFAFESSIIEYGAKLLNKNKFSGRYLKKYKLTTGEYYIFVGRFVPEKGVHNLIDKYLNLKTTKLLVIIGDDTNETTYKTNLFQKANKHKNIIMTGFLYNEEYEELLSNAYLYISASELEGTSPSLLAAMGSKVCTLVNGIEENMQTIKSAGVWFEKCNYLDLLKKWQFCEDNPNYVDEMAQKGYLHVKENYCWEAISLKYIKLFDNIN